MCVWFQEEGMEMTGGEVPGTELQRNINCEQVRLSWQLRMQSVCLNQTNGSAWVAFI